MLSEVALRRTRVRLGGVVGGGVCRIGRGHGHDLGSRLSEAAEVRLPRVAGLVGEREFQTPQVGCVRGEHDLPTTQRRRRFRECVTDGRHQIAQRERGSLGRHVVLANRRAVNVLPSNLDHIRCSIGDRVLCQRGGAEHCRSCCVRVRGIWRVESLRLRHHIAAAVHLILEGASGGLAQRLLPGARCFDLLRVRVAAMFGAGLRS